MVAQNSDPSFTSSVTTFTNKDAYYTYTISSTDGDLDSVTIAGTTVPNWLTLHKTNPTSLTLECPMTVTKTYDEIIFQLRKTEWF